MSTKTKSIFPIVFEDNGQIGRGNPVMDLQLTQEQANALFTEKEIKDKEKRFGVVESKEGFGRYNPYSVTGVVVRSESHNDNGFFKTTKIEIVKSKGTLYDVKNFGYEGEGRISIAGKKVRGFTSSKIFRLPDGELINVAVIHLGS